jgi:EAL domain-containing protein (putative c-di-GMP-specific phosphodiesterase class I)
VKAVVDLARAVNISVVAVGVETGDTARLLRDSGCDEAQGYFFRRPGALHAFEA